MRILPLLLLVFSLAACTRPGLAPKQAANHVGETCTVVGKVASADYFPALKGKPTFLNLDRPYPNHSFTIVIWEEDRPKFSSPPELLFAGKTVAVSGKIQSYKGKPEITLREPSKVEIRK